MKEIRITFDINLSLDRCDVNYLEDELLKRREEVFKKITAIVLKILEEEILKKEIRCPNCGGSAIQKGFNRRKIETLLGEIDFKRKRFRCKVCCEEFYPLDEALGLEPQRKCTLGVVERMLWTAVEVSYEKAGDFLKKFTGLEVSRGHIHHIASDEGRRIQQWEEERRRNIFEEAADTGEFTGEPPEVLYIQVDGTAINDRESKEWMECKVGVSFSQRVLISKDRIWLMDKKSYASIEGVEAFGEKFFLECVKQGVLKAKKVFFIGDGARWVRTLKDNYFPSAIGVLDIWHLERELKMVLGKERETLIESLKGLAFEGNAREIIKRLMEEGVNSKDPEKIKKIAGVMDYVKNNLDWIENIPKAGGYGSGPVEKTVDITVARRFKKRGMSWYKKGANPLLKLRLLKLNGEWDNYWLRRKEDCAKFLAA